MERQALGYSRLSAAEFDAMTPQEVSWRIAADVQRENREWERVAALACWVINPWIKGKGIKPTDLIGTGKKPKREERWQDWIKD